MTIDSVTSLHPTYTGWRREKWRICNDMLTYLWNHKSKLHTKFSMHVIYGCGLILLWCRSNVLCTFVLVDDVIFSHSGPYGAGDANIWCKLKVTHETQVAERSKADLPKGSTGPVWSLMFTMALIFSYRVCSAEILTMSSDVNVS